MEIKIARAELYNAFQRCQGIIPARGPMSILSYILLETTESGISLTSTDLEVTLKASVPAQILEPGRTTLLARKVFEIIRELPEGEIHLKEQGANMLQIRSGKISFNLTGLPADDFPALPQWDPQAAFSLDPRQLNDMIRKTIFAIPSSEVRYSMTGALLEMENDNIAMAGTDGHRLAFITQKHNYQAPQKISYIIPRKVLTELKKLLEGTEQPVSICTQDNHIIFTSESVILLGRLIEGNFPNYQRVIPRDEEISKRITASKNDLHHALRRVSILADEKSHGIKVRINEATLYLNSPNTEVGDAHEELAVQYAGEEFSVGFNAEYVLDFLGAVDEEEIQMELNNPDGPCLFHPQGNRDYLCVIMPMKVE